MGNVFNLEIYTPDRVFFKGQAESLVVNTETGEMGILYQTLPIVTMLSNGIMKILQDGKRMEAVNSAGFISVGRDVVTVLVESAYWPHEIDVHQVQEEIDSIDLEKRKERSYAEYKLAKAQLALQFAKLKLKNRNL